jgi:hypothetical protein
MKIISTRVEDNFKRGQKEDLILYHVQEVVGFGRVTFDKGSNSHRYVVEDTASIYKLAHLFNGNLVMGYRIDQLANWIKVLQTKDYSIIEILTPITISLQDAWLSGFTDAEGCFTVFTGKSTGLKFILDQNNKEILDYIAVLFGGGAVTTRNLDSYRYQASRLFHLIPIISYFENFSLKTKKNNSFLIWCKAYKMVLNKEHRVPEGLEALKDLAKRINPKS